MAINISVQCNGGLLPGIILLLTQGYYHWGTRLCLYSLPGMKQYTITTMFDYVLHIFCFVFAFYPVSLHGD